MRKRVFIGDVQGCADELEDLLELLRYDPSLHQLWFAGDLVNRGPESARVLRTAIGAGADSVLGNHDLHLLRAAAGLREARPADTFHDVLAAPDRDRLLHWLRARPVLREWDDVILVHAGLHPQWKDLSGIALPLEASIRSGAIPWDDPNLRFLVQARYCDPHGNLSSSDNPPGPPFRPWDEYHDGRKTVVFGHWSARGLVVGDRVRGLDTGCVWGGRLTAWIAEEDRIVSVPARRQYQTPG